MLQAVIFDMDGVIVDSHPIHRKAWSRFLELQGKPARDADLNFIMDGRKRDEILRHFLGDLSDEEVLILGHEKEQLFREEAGDLRTINGLVGFVEELAKVPVKMGVASSGSASRVNYILNAIGLRKYFATVITGDHVPLGKPDPMIFRLACDHLCARPTETLVFEDSISGVRAAKAAGTTCVGVAIHDAGPLLLAAGADEIIPDFSLINFERMLNLPK
jgi:beta-phosphoglucomutase